MAGVGLGGIGVQWAACWRAKGRTFRMYCNYKTDAEREAMDALASGAPWAVVRRPWWNGKRAGS